MLSVIPEGTRVRRIDTGETAVLLSDSEADSEHRVVNPEAARVEDMIRCTRPNRGHCECGAFLNPRGLQMMVLRDADREADVWFSLECEVLPP